MFCCGFDCCIHHFPKFSSESNTISRQFWRLSFVQIHSLNLCLNDGDSHVPGICTLSFLPLPAAASSAASCEPGTLTIFHQAGVSLPLPLWSPAVFQSHKLPVKIYQCSIINTTKDDHKHNSNLRIPLHLPYLWEDDLISLKQKVKCTDATALKWQKAAKVASSIDFLICITQ